jgi:hypothetical protein
MHLEAWQATFCENVMAALAYGLHLQRAQSRFWRIAIG